MTFQMIGAHTHTDIFIYRDLKERRKNSLENGRESQNCVIAEKHRTERERTN